METLPWIIFNRILKYATRNSRLLKHCVTWERVSKRFGERLKNNFWPKIEFISIDYSAGPLPTMLIGYDNYDSIDVNAFIGFRQRGILKSGLSFYMKNISLPKEFANSVPVPVRIDLGKYCNLTDPELLLTLKLHKNRIKVLYLSCTNPTIDETFIEGFSSLTSLKRLQLNPQRISAKCSIELRRLIYSKLAIIAPKCLVLSSADTPSFENMFGEEIFAALENTKIQCLHLESLNHYIDRYLQNSLFHNRANITHLCILNDITKILFSAEKGNESAKLCHTVAEYKLLFPKIKFVCISVLVDFIDNWLDAAIIESYYKASSDVQIRLVAVLKMPLHQKWEQFSWNKFDSIVIKLKHHGAEIRFENGYLYGIKRRLIARSRDGRFHFEIRAFNEFKTIGARLEYTHYIANKKMCCLCVCSCRYFD